LAPFARDLGDAYTARIAGRAPRPDPLPVDFADVATWQRDRLGSSDDPDSEQALLSAFWQRALAGAPAEIALPRDRARAAADPEDPELQGAGELRLDLD